MLFATEMEKSIFDLGSEELWWDRIHFCGTRRRVGSRYGIDQ